MLHSKEFYLGPDHDWLILVHGAGGSSAIFFRQVRAFKPYYNLLMVDLRGHGKSEAMQLTDMLKGNYSFDMVSRDVLEVMDKKGISSAHLMGISLGTIIIRTMSEIAPERVKTLVMGGAIAKLNLQSKFLVAIGNGVKRYVPYMWLYKIVAWIIMPKRKHSFARNIFIREARKLQQAEFLRWFDLTKELNGLLRYFFENDIKVPTLYIMGEEDHMFLPQVREQVKYQKNSILKIIKKCGHVCNIEAPEIFNRLSLEFLGNHRERAAY
jgi:pimeloyl-ACP methyl ester carboxylesterase